MQNRKRKIYAYIDESGQDTKGQIFIVGVLILGEDKDFVLFELSKIEAKSGKKNLKWNKSRHEARKKYIESLLNFNSLQGRMFFEFFSDSDKYIELTSYATAKAILKNSGTNYQATVYIDGFKRKELEIFKRELRDLRVKIRKIRTVKKDENNGFIRLADAICGLARDAEEDNSWAKDIFRKLPKKKMMVEL